MRPVSTCVRLGVAQQEVQGTPSHCLFRVCGPLDILEKSAGYLCGEVSRRGTTRYVNWWNGVSGNHQGREDDISQVNGEVRFGTHLYLPAEFGVCQHYLPLARAALTPAFPTLALKLINLLSPQMSLLFFELLLCALEPRVSEFVSR